VKVFRYKCTPYEAARASTAARILNGIADQILEQQVVLDAV